MQLPRMATERSMQLFNYSIFKVTNEQTKQKHFRNPVCVKKSLKTHVEESRIQIVFATTSVTAPVPSHF